jgi:hypothetical protein
MAVLPTHATCASKMFETSDRNLGEQRIDIHGDAPSPVDFRA